MKLKILLITVALFVGSESWGQYWNGSTNSSTSGTIANIVAAFGSTQGNNNGTTTLITTTAPSTGYTTASGVASSGTSNFGAACNIGALNTSTSTYFTITLTPTTNYKINLASINFGSRGTGTGPTTITVYSSIDNYATAIGSVGVLANSTWSTSNITFSGSNLLGATNTVVTLRIYGSGGIGSPVTGTANWRIDDVTFTCSATSADIPNLTTPTVSSITPTTATLGATVTADGGAAITSRGTVWGIASTPTANLLTEGGTSVSAFSHSRTGLTPNTLYYYRGYAVSSNGTGYSPDGTFTTLHNAPTVGTGSGATSSSIVANWTAPTGGGSASYTYEIQVDDDSAFGSVNYTQSSIASGTITTTATGLSSSTTYYYRVRTVNAGGNSAWSSTSLGYATLAPQPEINVRGVIGLNPSITDGDTVPQGTDNTLFAATNIGSSQSKNFRIENLGTGTNTLTITSIAMIGGTAATNFVLSGITFPTSISGGNFVDFTVTFNPSGSGTRNTTLTIINNDSNESTYDFLIEGTGNCTTATNTITPTSGPIGTEVTINSATNLTGATVSFNGTAATIIPVSSTQIKVLVPAGAISGNLITTFTTGCQATNAFTVINNVGNTCEGGNTASDLFISEVTDANWGGLTYVEIYNGTGVSKNLSGYSINTASNGNAYSGSPLNLSNVNLASGSTYVVAFGDDDLCTTPYGDGSLAVQSTVNLGVNFKANENDHIALFNGATKIDSWGIFGSDNWATSSLSIFATETNGATFRRKNTGATLPSTTYANADWEIIDFIGKTNADCDNNDYSDIGIYNFISGTPPTVATPSYTATCKTATLTVSGTEGYNGSSPADTKELTYQWLVSAPNATGWTYIINDSNYSGALSPTLAIANIAVVTNYQYYCQVRENTNTCYTASNAVKIIDGTITWDGTNWRDINNAITSPTIDKLVIINANYNTSTVGLDSFSACSVVVNSGKTLTITENEYVKIQNDLTNNGTVTIENNGSLVQVNDDGVNAGMIRYERTTPLVKNTDYTYWSSPVAGYTLGGVSQNLTVADKYYSFNSTIDDWEQKSAATTMDPGIGYIIRGPEPSGPIPPGTPDIFEAYFTGVPNNGVYPISSILPGKSYLLGNPYPSSLNADKFLDANSGVLDGTLYFWTHNTEIQDRNNIISIDPDTGLTTAGSGALAYTSDDYASYNGVGGVAASDGKIPLGKIASGQGFFALSNTTIIGSNEIIFNNSMRLSSDIVPAVLDNSQFFKTKNTKETKTFEKHRIWLNLTNAQGAFKQTLVGYITDATNQYDSRFDGISFDGNEFVDFYSVNQEKNLVIQGRALPFDENDEVPLGFRTTISGDFTIKIDQADGVLTNQTVYIEDKLTNSIFDLRSGSFTFNTAAGTFSDRFVLRYTNKTLGTKDLETLENQVLVSNQKKQIKVNSAFEIIDKVTVYDLLGRQLFKKDKVSSNELAIPNLVSSHQTLLVKIILQNGETVTRKIVF